MRKRSVKLLAFCISILLLLGLCSQALAASNRAAPTYHAETEALSDDVTVTHNGDGTETYEIEVTADTPSADSAAPSEPDAIVDVGTHYENAGDAVDVRIEKAYQEGEPLVTVGTEQASVAFYPVAAPASTEAQADVDGVLYEGLFEEGTDVKLYATQNGVKEDIIVASYSGNHVYPYRMTFAGVTPVQTGKAILLYDAEQNAVGCIVEPYMWDAAGETSGDIQVDFRGLGNSEYELTYTPNDAWLADPNRAYPVTIDPYIDYYLGAPAGSPTTSIAATYVNSGSPGSNYYGSGTLYAGGSYTMFVQPTLRSDITAYTANTMILAAYLKPASASNPTAMNIYPVYSSWNAGSITANNMPQMGSALPGGSARWVPALYAWDISPVVSSWFDAANMKPNYGFAVGNPGSAVCSVSASFTVSITLYRITENISPSAVGYANGCDAGYINVTWNFAPLSNYTEYYLIGVYNGREYEYFRSDLNASSWSTRGKGIWPTPAEVASGRYKLHLDGTGAELPASPLATYQNAGAGYNSTAYRFIILPCGWSTVPEMSYVYQPANPGYAASATLPNVSGSHSYVYGPWQQHSGTQHKRQITCSVSGCSYSSWEYASHSFSYGAWTSTGSTQHSRTKTCSVCGYSTTETANHRFIYGNWSPVDDTRHSRSVSCSDCNYASTEYGDHHDDNHDGKCDDCGYQHQHEYEYGDWTPISDTEHERTGECDCGETTTQTGPHKDTDSDGKCDDCGYEIKDKALVVHTQNAAGVNIGAGAQYRVLDKNGTAITRDGSDVLATGNNGDLSLTGLGVGDYTVIQVQPPAGYARISTQSRVTVRAANTASNPADITFVCLPLTMRIEASDAASGTAISGARFIVTDVVTNTAVKLKLTDGVYYADTNGAAAYVQTDSTGTATVCGLPRGNYKLTEAASVSSYFPIPSRTVAVQQSHDSGNPLIVTIHYEKEIKLGMDTDRYDGLLIALIGAAATLAAAATILLIVDRRKRKQAE